MGGVKKNFGGVEHFIRGVREILGGLTPPNPPPPPSKSAHALNISTDFVLQPAIEANCKRPTVFSDFAI
jgi:hypothetical protein